MHIYIRIYSYLLFIYIYMYSLDFLLDERTQEPLSKRSCLVSNSISWLHRCKKRNIDLPFLCECKALLQRGPSQFVNGFITPISMVITPLTQL